MIIQVDATIDRLSDHTLSCADTPYLELSSTISSNTAPDLLYGTTKRIHVVENDMGARARLARMILSIGFHAEIYSSVDEFISFAPTEGIILVNDDVSASGASQIIEQLGNGSIWLPVIVYQANPQIERVIKAIKAGAADYISFDCPQDRLIAAFKTAEAELKKRQSRRSLGGQASTRINMLSAREKQVLELLVDGASNKEIARKLEISPRTVEIHRMKMMGKINAKTAGEAVKLWCMAYMNL
jgi:FixJ family two-component response regulator